MKEQEVHNWKGCRGQRLDTPTDTKINAENKHNKKHYLSIHAECTHLVQLAEFGTITLISLVIEIILRQLT